MWQAAQTIFLSIVLESLPFILLGVLLSSLIQEIVPREKMLRMIPKNGAMAVVFSSFLGFVLPVCDCGSIPVARSLMRKGVPVSAAMTFVLAAPVVNPLTMIATYFAFGMNPSMMWARTTATLVIAVAIGWVLLSIESKRRKLSRGDHYELPMLEMAATGAIAPRRTVLQVSGAVIEHAVIEFFEVGGFVIISAAVATLLQTFVPVSLISPIGQHPVWSVLAMMALASLLSLCSEADAFVARSLAGLTMPGGVLGFLVTGQMIDMRNIFLLPRVFPGWAVKIAFCLAIVLPLCVGIWFNHR